jgi:hypothetical protein
VNLQEIESNLYKYNNVEEAADGILHMMSKFIDVNTLCVTSVEQKHSIFIGAFNRKNPLVEKGTNLSLYDAY